MRISDWSSDVCSSDLIIAGFLLLLTPDTDRDAMIAKYGGPNATFAAGPAGQRIHYRDLGRADGPPIILIHGANASLHTWEPLVKRLGDRKSTRLNSSH